MPAGALLRAPATACSLAQAPVLLARFESTVLPNLDRGGRHAHIARQRCMSWRTVLRCAAVASDPRCRELRARAVRRPDRSRISSCATCASRARNLFVHSVAMVGAASASRMRGVQKSEDEPLSELDDAGVVTFANGSRCRHHYAGLRLGRCTCSIAPFDEPSRPARPPRRQCRCALRNASAP